MDKSLKHLSRLDLLELMVKLSEENDAIAAENVKLKQALAARPTMSRAAKVGSIAELALQANGFFEAAQHAADDYLREIKRMRDQVAARTAAGNQAAAAPAPVNVAQGQASNAQAMMGNVQVVTGNAQAQAQAQAQAILARANSQAEAIVTDARKKAEAMLTDASRQSRSIISRANHQADAVIQAARSDAQQQVARANGRRQQSASASASTASTPRGRHARPGERGQ